MSGSAYVACTAYVQLYDDGAAAAAANGCEFIFRVIRRTTIRVSALQLMVKVLVVQLAQLRCT